MSARISATAEGTALPRAVIADDHALIAHGVADLLAGMVEVVAVVHDGLSAIAEIRHHQPDLALVDLNLPLAHGTQVHAEARRWSPATRFVVLTGSATPGLLAEIVETGVHGLFLKSGPPDELAAAVPRMLAGETVLGMGVAEALAQAEATGLTRRELQILQEIAAGSSSQRISERLGISAKTVENHRASLMRKLEVHSTASLIMAAIRRGLVSTHG
jgi:two-component system, NarL family, invasion response regulator UvrY